MSHTVRPTWWRDEQISIAGSNSSPCLWCADILFVCSDIYTYLWHPSTSLPLTIQELFVYLFHWKLIENNTQTNKANKEQNKQISILLFRISPLAPFFEWWALPQNHKTSPDFPILTMEQRIASPAQRVPWGMPEDFLGSDRVIQVPWLMQMWYIYIYI